MIALGKWEMSVKTMIYSGKILLNIFDDGGKYGYEMTIPGMKAPKIDIKEINENGNIIDAVLSTPLLPGKDIALHAEFDGDTVEGYAKLPIFGKVKITDGRRILSLKC